MEFQPGAKEIRERLLEIYDRNQGFYRFVRDPGFRRLYNSTIANL